jgi:hypothetical protein
VSRDAFSYDPQDTRETAPRRSARGRTPARTDAGDARQTAAQVPDRAPTTEPRDHPYENAERSDSQRAYYVRDRAYLLRDSELHSLKEVGKFRVIAVADLAKYAYHGDRNQMERDIRYLRKQGLLTGKNVEISQKKSLRVVTLTKTGHRLLTRSNQLPDDQAVYHGLLKPREVTHDADLYRLYQKEAARIEEAGGRPIRVMLDYELKKNLNRDLALLGTDRDNEDRKSEIAQKHGLQLVNGKIPVPDLRVEYETVEMEVRHIDFELATREYRPKAVAEKAAAGFSLYSRPEDASRLRRILDEREITAGFLTL